VIGTLLAGLAGVVGAPVFNSLDPATWTIAVFIASTAVVVGRFRSVPVTFFGGIAIGILMALTFRYVHVGKIDGLNNAVPFILLLGGLLVLGRNKARAGGTASLEAAPVDWNADLPLWRRKAIPAIAFCVVLLWILAFANPLWSSLLLRGAAFSLIMLSLTIVTRLGGMISLAQSSFALVASLSAGLLIGRYPRPARHRTHRCRGYRHAARPPRSGCRHSRRRHGTDSGDTRPGLPVQFGPVRMADPYQWRDRLDVQPALRRVAEIL